MHPDNGRWQGRGKREEGRGGAKGQKSREYCLLLLRSHQQERGHFIPKDSPRFSYFTRVQNSHVPLLAPKIVILSNHPSPPLPFPSDPQFVISISPLSRRYCEKPAFLPSFASPASPLSFCVSLLGFHSTSLVHPTSPPRMRRVASVMMQ